MKKHLSAIPPTLIRYRVREFLKLLSSNCEKQYRLNKHITIDETMVAHKGRLSYKQYMKAKLTKWGIKVWVLAESPSGYIYKFDVYLGKSTDEDAGTRLSHRVVHSLVDSISGVHHHLYMDNFYTDLFCLLISWLKAFMPAEREGIS